MIDQIKGGFFGAAVGDALGVPVEFSSRTALSYNPVVSMRGYGVWHQPAGTFSDDSSLLFCTAESLSKGFDIADMASTFIRWYKEGYWGAHNVVFDIGNATRNSLNRLISGTNPTLAGGMMEHDNGNGSLMRILPLVFHLKNEPSIEERYRIVKLVSGLTHGHFRSVFACFIYVEFGIRLLANMDVVAVYKQMQDSVNAFAKAKAFSSTEVALFDKVLQQDISLCREDEIGSSGYVIDTLESSLWCLLTSSSYQECVLKAVNLGEDTDTTATVAGGLAGILYGYSHIPAEWLQTLVKHQEINELAERFAQKAGN
ncbi:ADP-ribosylglycohydrolase family protein [Spirosoma fluviale]|uniref:ADP-ribosylglycohydrolase n=1 Tax=Spirosoma fluviale TaxID=1597977 RepID=A0A286F7B4_9BACT|nr:ADP-ribosylglycohydrolase family protein [Spirosoma fluviale]SOD78889.1 ADP-ribosylglycohydrolase [Spirosoma fluviale]